MKVYYNYITALMLSVLLTACKPSLDNKLNSENYKSDLKKLVNKYESTDILKSFEEKEDISSEEYNEMIDYLSNEDSLELVKDFAYKKILLRIKYNDVIRKEKEDEERKKELEKIAFQTNYVTIKFRDTKQEVERKIKFDTDSTLSTFYIKKGEKKYRLNLGNCEPYFAYNKDYGDNKERLDFFSFSLDIHAASTYKDYYVGATKTAYEEIINYLENLYGKADHYYPELTSYSVGYGDRFTVAKWKIGQTYINVEMYEKKEIWDENGYDSYKTKYIVSATLFNFDKNLKVSDNE
ncbi:MAG: hypothetical protein A2068_02535 [Ignavibacteria bacterium GWB2_35_6b]|nr:MAG: hypothetical protein A2068_02535 [Ignavibacteria bacterium GWB2_35_6b]